MGNTLTNLISEIHAALDVVSNEPVGFIGAVTLDASAERAAVGQNVRSHVAPSATAEDITPNTNPPDTGDQTIGNTFVSITKAKAVPFRWSGEEQKGINSGGIGYRRIQRDQIAQALRSLRNEMEADIAAMYAMASRAYGTPGTPPFGSSVGDAAQVRKILIDNGAPQTDLHLITDTGGGANLRSLGQLTKANEAGTTETLRRGELLDLGGFMIRESAQVADVTKGTGSGYLVNNGAGYPVGATAITVDTGSGTILAGDIVTFAGDTNKYVVATALAANVVTLAAPGLRKAVADDAALTVGANYKAGLALARNAIVLLARQPALPEEGDMAEDVLSLPDPVTGVTYEFAMYKQFRRVRYQVGLAWGVKCLKPEHLAILLG